MKILAIDIGYHNMGLVLAEAGNGPKIEVEYMKKVSLEEYKYIYSNDCSLSFSDTLGYRR